MKPISDVPFFQTLILSFMLMTFFSKPVNSEAEDLQLQWFVWRIVWCITSVNVQEHQLAGQGMQLKVPGCLLAPLWAIGSLFIGYHVGPWLP